MSMGLQKCSLDSGKLGPFPLEGIIYLYKSCQIDKL